MTRVYNPINQSKKVTKFDKNYNNHLKQYRIQILRYEGKKRLINFNIKRIII